jgi:hypothetical protein
MQQFSRKIEWEVFTGKQYGRIVRAEARVTLGQFGTFYLNKWAFAELGEPQAVEMLFDKTRRVIGLRPTAITNAYGFKIVPHSTGTHMRLSAAAFCRHHKMFFKGTILFNNVRVDENGIMMLDIVNATIVTRGSR